MKRYLTVGIVSGILLIAVVAISWFLIPGWNNPATGGFWVLVGAAAVGVITFVQGMISIWRDLKEETKSATLQSIDSQNADSIYNAPGGTINIVQQAKISESSKENARLDVDQPSAKNEENQGIYATIIDGLNWDSVSSSIIFDWRLRDAFPGLRG
jgi:hypothetical protein